MIKEIIHDPILLAQKSEPATVTDVQVTQDLLDTFTVNKEVCVGVALNMIGVYKQIFVFDNEGTYMYNKKDAAIIAKKHNLKMYS